MIEYREILESKGFRYDDIWRAYVLREGCDIVKVVFDNGSRVKDYVESNYLEEIYGRSNEI
jgi:hypothetical protein